MSQNGQLSNNELAPISGGGRLRKDAAAARNGLAAYCLAMQHTRLEVTDSYRPLGKIGDLAAGRWSQWAAWERYQQGGNLAAAPSTSNHGWGLAVDCPPPTQDAIHKWGPGFGWDKRTSDAPSEPWHFRWNGKVRSDLKKWCIPPEPVLKPGSAGPAVVVMKNRLRAWGAWPRLWKIDSHYRGRTGIAVRNFQRAHKLKADGIVGPTTWKALHSKPPGGRIPLVKPKYQAPKRQPKPPALIQRVTFADIYAGDTPISLAAYRHAGHKLLGIKATEGRTFTDPEFHHRARAARNLGIDLWIYHFARPSNNTGRQAGEFFAQTVLKDSPMRPGDRLILDFEDDKAKGNLDKWVADFIKAVADHNLTVRVIYSGAYYLTEHLSKIPFDQTGKPLRVWGAAYTQDPEGLFERVCPWAYKHLRAVQYTDSGQLPGLPPGDVNRLV